MLGAEKKVTEFHHKYGFSVGEQLAPDKKLQPVAKALAVLSTQLDPDQGLPACRVHLMIEELSELTTALADGNRLALLDALADLAYVVIGTAIAYGLPLSKAFEEVHRSNMTKTVIRSRPGHPDKGLGYQPPNLADLLGEIDNEQV